MQFVEVNTEREWARGSSTKIAHFAANYKLVKIVGRVLVNLESDCKPRMNTQLRKCSIDILSIELSMTRRNH